MRLLPLLTTIALANWVLGAGSPITATVSLDYGTFTGSLTNDILSFRGIPYAEPPVGRLRWRAPISPPRSSLGNVDVTKFGKRCIVTTQTTADSDTSENCLFGNVYVPAGTTTESGLPVLVYFHGGGFQGGSPRDAIPDRLFQSSSDPFIFVTFQYRLGQFGFLGGTRVKQDGQLNAGLLDQRSALHWVQRYIGSFGGDKTKVTIWGQSAGAGSTMFHLLGNGGNNEDLFRAAMGDSPSLSFVPLYSSSYVENIFEDFASFAGCDISKSHDIMDCLRAAKTNTLARAGNMTIETRTNTLYVFAPIFDQVFLLDRPVEGFQAGRVARVPVFFGSNSDEGAGWADSLNGAADTTLENSTESTVYNFLQGQYATFSKSSFSEAVNVYPLADYNDDYDRQRQQMYGEARYICTAGLITGGISTAIGTKAYRYHYDNPITGSGHGSELAAIFSLEDPSDTSVQTLFEQMRQYWTSFVTSGVPVARGATKWTGVSGSDGGPQLLLHPGGVRMEEISDFAPRCRFWHGLSEEINT